MGPAQVYGTLAPELSPMLLQFFPVFHRRSKAPSLIFVTHHIPSRVFGIFGWVGCGSSSGLLQSQGHFSCRFSYFRDDSQSFLLGSPLRIELISDIDHRKLELVLHVDVALRQSCLGVRAVNARPLRTPRRSVASPLAVVLHIAYIVVDAGAWRTVVGLRAIVSSF